MTGRENGAFPASAAAGVDAAMRKVEGVRQVARLVADGKAAMLVGDEQTRARELLAALDGVDRDLAAAKSHGQVAAAALAAAACSIEPKAVAAAGLPAGFGPDGIPVAARPTPRRGGWPPPTDREAARSAAALGCECAACRAARRQHADGEIGVTQRAG